MSDATKLIVGIVLALVVIALIVWLFASARRREVDARRMEAEAVRARLAERVPVVQEREDRASVTAQIAEDARREAEAAAAEAARLEQEAAEHRTEAERMKDEQAALEREADRLDPDVPTDEEGYRVDDSGRRLTGSTVASAFGAGAVELEHDDEPDLADHENPFAGYAAQPAGREGDAASAHSTVPTSESVPPPTPDSSGQNVWAGEGDDADWVNSPVDEEAADEVEAQAARDAEAADWINGPEDDELATYSGEAAGSAHSTGRGEAAGSAHSTVVDDGSPFEAGDAGDTAAGAAAPEDDVEAPAARRISDVEEVADGGYGVGSAAPIADGAQPLGHPVMGYRDSMTFTRGDAGARASDPDVWFYDEEAARRAGFRPAGEE